MKKILTIVVSLFLLSAAAVHADEVKDACSSLVIDYAYHRDNFNAADFANLFTEDGTLIIGDQAWTGRNAIRARIEALDNQTTIRHLMSTIRIVAEGPDHATGTSYATIYSAPPGERQVEGFALMGEYHDQFVRTPEGWKISHRELKTAFNYGRE